MTQDELWLAKWQEAVDFLETNHRKLSKFIAEELKGTKPMLPRTRICYKDGAFTQDCSMEEMIGFCAQFVDGVNNFR